MTEQGQEPDKQKAASSSKLGPIIAFLIAAAIGGFAGYRALFSKSSNEDGLPYQYDVSKYTKIPADKIKWSEVQTIQLKGESVRGIASDSGGNIYVGIDKKVQTFTPKGELSSQNIVDAKPTCLVVVGGTTYIGFEDHIQVHADKKPLKWPSLGEKAYVCSIAVDKDFLYAADFGNRCVWQFSLGGEMKNHVRESTGPFSIPSPYFDVAIGQAGLLIVDPGRQDIGSYDADLKRTSGWGKPGMDLAGFPGCCNPSHICVLPNGNIATSEKGIARIKVYSPNGKLLEVVAGPKSFPKNNGPFDLACDRNGRLMVLDASLKQVRIFERKRETPE